MSHRMDFESGSPHRTTQSEYSRYQTKLTGYSTASQQTSRIFEAAAASLNRGNALQKREFGSVLRASESLDLVELKTNEKELLHGLNDRFAGFIEKVRDLEHQNQLLEREIEDIRQKAQSPSSLAQQYEPELRDLRKQVNDITLQKRQIEIEHQDLEEDVLNLREKYDQEACYRSDAESNIIVLKKDINDTYLAKLQLDKKAQSMVDEIHFLKKNHEIEVSEMLAQMQETQVKVEAHHFGKPDITAALREIRAQLKVHAVSDIQQAEECFRAQFAKLTKAAETNREALKATKQEIQEHKRRLQGKNIELDCAKGTREALAKQLDELEDRHNAEMVHYQDTMRQLENELTIAKFDISGHLREHQDLLNVNMALDVEIHSFRQLLEGEESRVSTISDTHISMPYTYRQSPVYTLPCLARQGVQTRRAEPQKFVEEIITKTIREVEMSEFEDTRSEETVGGEGAYQRMGEELAKTERERNEEKEEEEDKAGLCEEAPEKEDEKASEDQQVETSTEHGDGVSPAEAEEGDEGKEETGYESDAVERKEDTVKPIQSEVKSVEASSDKEKDQLYTAENIDSEQFQNDDPSKREDSQTEAPIEDEISKQPKKSEPEDSLKQSALKEKKEPDLKEDSASVEEQQGSKKESPLKESPLIESKEVDLKEDITPLLEQKPELATTDLKELKDTDQSTEPASTVTVQEEALPVPSEETSTDKTSTEVTTEMKTTPAKAIWEPVKSSADTKAPEIPSTTPEKEEKAPSPTEPKVISKDESFKTTEEDSVKITKDETKDEKNLKESATSPKPDLMTIPKEEEIKETSSGDKATTGAEESIIPRETTAVPESKDSHSMAPESNTTQPDKAQEIPSTPEREEKAPKSPEKEMSPTEPQVSSKDESVKITEEELPKGSVKITKDETKDENIFKESETSPKPDLTAIPQDEEMEKAPKSPEKEMSPTEPKVSSKDESANITEQETPKGSVKITKDEIKDENIFKESETSPKPDLTAIPQEEEIKEISSGDKATAGAEEFIIPEKHTAVAESKDSHSMAPESNTTQEDKAQEIPSTPERKEKAPKSPEKEMSPKEPKVSSKDESVKITEQETPKGSVKITKDETKDDLVVEKKMKESETLPKPDLTAIAEEDKIKETSSGDKAMAGAEESIILDKTTAVEESKDSHSMAPESNATQRDKAQEIPSTPEREEKAPSPTEPQVSSKDESVKITEQETPKGSVKITKDETKDENIFKESETSPKPDLMAIPKEEEIKETNSGDKAMTPAEEFIIPDKTKTTAVAESKDSHSMATERNTTQRDKAQEIPSTPERKEKAPKSPEKEMSLKEPKVSSKDESVKTTEEETPKGSVKITKDETKDDLVVEKKVKESETLPKPDLTAIAEEDKIKGTSSGDKAMAGAEESIILDKTTAVEESKDSHSMAPESNATQRDKAQEIPSTPEREEKAPSPTEPKVNSKDESLKTTEEDSVKITKDETKDEKNLKESATSPKSDLTAIPQDEEMEKASKSPEKEISPTEPKVGSKDESVKITEEEIPKGSVKITKDETKDDLIVKKKVKESETLPKPDLTAIAKEEEIKETSSGDKAMAGAEESIILDKTTAVAESKDSYTVAPESNTTQEKSEEIAKEPEKVLDPKDVPTKTESVKTKESEVVIKSQKEAKPEQVEISIIKTSPVKEDVSAMGLKEKAVDERKTEEEESKIENDFSEDDGVSKVEKTGSKTKEQAEPIKEQKAVPKTSV